MYCLTQLLLDASESKNLLEQLLANKNSWLDGKKTAGSHAAGLKNNLQLDRNSITSKECSDLIAPKITGNKLIKSFALPRQIHGIMFTRMASG